MKDENKFNAMFCEHANEVPSQCNCGSDCYCKNHTCSWMKTTKQESKLNMDDMATNNDLNKPGEFDNRRFE